MFSEESLAPVVAPLAEARPLPARAYLEEEAFQLDLSAVWGRSWVCVGREQEASLPGEFLLAPLGGAGLLAVRGEDLELRAFHNVCQHRGACLTDEPRGRSARLRCPYHGWVYDLRGRGARASLRPGLAAEACGLLFVCGGEPWGPLGGAVDGLAEALAPFALRKLWLGRRVTDEARANWKLLAENFLESHHFPATHPELEAITPASRASTLPPRGAWFGGTMEISEPFETVAHGGLIGARKRLHRGRIVHDFLIFPGCMLSVQPDYLLVYRLWPVSASLTRVVSEIWFHPGTSRDLDLSGVYSFWDAVNAQDRAACEGQQRGLSSPGYAGGVFTPVEESVHRFDAMIARCYLGRAPW